MTTIDNIYAALNPIPARLSEKGKVNPRVDFTIEANARMHITVTWKKYGAVSEWEQDYNMFAGNSFGECMEKAEALVAGLPSAEQARLEAFMSKLGKLIDIGKDEGVAVDYLNPLLDTMKRLSENAITYKPEPEPIAF